MSDSTLDRGIAGFSTMLLVLAGLMVAAGLVMPSAASAPPEFPRNSVRGTRRISCEMRAAEARRSAPAPHQSHQWLANSRPAVTASR